MAKKPTKKPTKKPAETKTVNENPVEKYNVVRPFVDRNGIRYKVGDRYQEISKTRTQALMERRKTKENRTGNVYLTTGE